jgi:hypothetical protein
VGIEKAASNVAGLQVTAKTKRKCVVLCERNTMKDLRRTAQDGTAPD